MYQVPRGTRDFTSNEMKNRRYVQKSMTKTFTSFGYGEIQTPTFENLELFTAKSGESITDEIYDFCDKGGRKLALRPELTAPVIRCYIEKMQMEPKPLKLFYFGNCYRYDRPQKGRYREFLQAGCELIGADTPEAHAELIALAYNLLKNVGVQHIILNIGNLTIIDRIFTKINLSQDCKKEILPLIDKSQLDDVYNIILEQGVSKENADLFLEILETSEIEKIKTIIKDDDVALTELSKLQQIIDLLHTSYNVEQYQIKMSIVRGLDYYKGLVFEIDAPVLGAEKQLCGGGAYDLVKLFGGRDIPTAGFAIGFDRTILALESENYCFPSPKTDIYIIPVNEDMIKQSIEIAQMLRKQGFITELDLLHRGVGKSLKHANSKNSENVIIVGPEELEKDAVTLRDMKTGDQQLVKRADILKHLKK